MKNILLNFIISTLFSSNLVLADCNKEQAFDKMIKLNQLNVELQNEVPKDPTTDPDAMNRAYERIKEYTDLIVPAGPLLAAGKYNEACAIYDQTAKHFNFNISSAKSLSMKQLQKDGGRSVSGKCNISDVAKRSVGLAQDFAKAYEEGRFTYERQRQFSKDSEELNALASSDPGRACEGIEKLRAEYGL